jgi:hypothetical protein
MSDTQTDPAAAYLAAAAEHAAEERRFVLPDSGRWSCEDVPRLADALSALLSLAGEWEASAAECDRRSEVTAGPLSCSRSILLSARAQGLTDCATALREAVSKHLPGETSE